MSIQKELLVHKSNFQTKIKENYGNIGEKIDCFMKTEYLPFIDEIEKFDLDIDNHFSEFVLKINEYRSKLNEFAKTNKIKSQSKLESTFLEEINYYLFKKICTSKHLDIFNKSVYAGLKINALLNVEIITKDVDFCIGKKVVVNLNENQISINVPIISIETKTYLDATMLREIKSSSRSIKSASPNSKSFVLIGYKNLHDSNLISLQQDSSIDEIYSLHHNKTLDIEVEVLKSYYKDILNSIEIVLSERKIPKTGRLLSF